MSAPPEITCVVRDDVVESVHRGHLVVADADGRVRAALGEAGVEVYPRSALKPLQALATLSLLDDAGVDLDEVGVAIACASHTGSADHQIEAARLLALAGLDEAALRTPPALPIDVPTLIDQRVPESLAHNCSGKHAGFLLATVAIGDDPADYLLVEARVQRLVRERVAGVAGAVPTGPSVDGCGAPAWRLPLRGLATAFARLAGAGTGDLARVRAAMSAHPELVGGPDAADSVLMAADRRVVAKRGAEGVLAAGFVGPAGAMGVAVKVADGAQRGAGPAVAALLARLGASVPDTVARPVVLAGGRPHGSVSAAAAVTGLLIER